MRPSGPLFDIDEAEFCEQVEAGRHRDRKTREAHQAKRPERVLPEKVDDDVWDKIEHADSMPAAMQNPLKHFIQILANGGRCAGKALNG